MFLRRSYLLQSNRIFYNLILTKKSSTKKSLNSDKSYCHAKMMMMRIGHLKLSNNSTMKITEETEMGLG